MKLTLGQKIRLKLFGMVYLEHRIYSGWRGPLPFYAKKCEKHGIYVDYPHGFDQEVSCPTCHDEMVEKVEDSWLKHPDLVETVVQEVLNGEVKEVPQR